MVGDPCTAGSYSDPGATAQDAVSGDVTSSITVDRTVDLTIAGPQQLTYTARDEAGLTASVVRVVTVVGVGCMDSTCVALCCVCFFDTPLPPPPARSSLSSVCLSVCLSVSLSLCLSLCLPVSLSLCLSVALSLCRSVSVSVSLSLSLSLCLCLCLCLCLSLSLSRALPLSSVSFRWFSWNASSIVACAVQHVQFRP